MAKKKRYLKGKGKYLRYRSENRKVKNKVSKLAKRWRTYKVQPPKALNGILDGQLKILIKNKIGK